MTVTTTRPTAGSRAARATTSRAQQARPARQAPSAKPARQAPSARPARQAPPVRRRPVAARTSPPRAPFVMLLLALIGTGLVGLLLMNTAVNENSVRLHQLQRQQVQLDVEEQQLAKDVAALEEPGALAERARRQGLVPAGTPAFIRLPDGAVLGVPKPAPTPSPSTAQPSTAQPSTAQPSTAKPSTASPGASAAGAR